MADPVTIGTLGALALSTAAEALVKGAVGEAVKDAYQGLKSLLTKRAAPDISALEENPKSAARQAVVGELIDGLPRGDLDEVAALVQRLTTALQSAASTHPIGVDLERLSAMNLTLESLHVSSGTGLKARDVTLSGDLTLGSLVVGDEGKASR
jgi:hypothetical protein